MAFLEDRATGAGARGEKSWGLGEWGGEQLLVAGACGMMGKGESPSGAVMGTGHRGRIGSAERLDVVLGGTQGC